MDGVKRTPLPKALLFLLTTVILISLAFTAGCGGGDDTPGTTTAGSGPSATAGTSTDGASPTSTGPGAESTAGTEGTADPSVAPATPGPVTFATEDGLTLSGHLYGSGDWGVVLSHMFPADQTSWTAAAKSLAQEGYLVLTFDFRGYGASEGSKDIPHIDRDVLAAAGYLRSAGASDVVLVGASMGGTASLVAASTLQAMSSLRLAGVATLSAPVEFEGLSAKEAVPGLVVPLLFIAAEDDGAANGARELRRLSGDKSDLRIVPGGEHGTDLFSGPQADAVWRLLLDFLQHNLEVGNL